MSVSWDEDYMMFDFNVVIARSEGCPNKLVVKGASIDEGEEHLQSISVSIESSEDYIMLSAKSGDDGFGERSIGGEGHGVIVRDDSGERKGDWSLSGKNRGSFIPRALMALKSSIRLGACISDLSTHKLWEGE
jgi:hypothetical protein